RRTTTQLSGAPYARGCSFAIFITRGADVVTLMRVVVHYFVLLIAISSIPVAHSRAIAQSTAPAARIGKIDGAAHEVFGKIVDIAVDDAGNVFILDQLNQHVVWFDAQGKHRAEWAR